jgi:hypothetical protein
MKCGEPVNLAVRPDQHTLRAELGDSTPWAIELLREFRFRDDRVFHVFNHSWFSGSDGF